MTREARESDGIGRSVAIGTAAGIAAGLFANLVRKAAVQAPTVAAGRWDKALAAEHAAALKLFDLLEETDDSATARRTVLLMQLKHAIGKHAFQEENVVYAKMRDAGLTEAADHLSHEHVYVKQYFFDLRETPKSDRLGYTTEGIPYIDQEAHARGREYLFSRLREQLSAAQNKLLSAAMNKGGLKLA